MSDNRLDFAATGRNKAPIVEVLRGVLPPSGVVMEVASGSGQHVVHFAEAFPDLQWQATDLNPKHVDSIASWIEHTNVPNVSAPLLVDVLAEWPEVDASALFCANMIHIAPWPCTPALFRGASGILRSGAPLVLYGPFRIEGEPFAESNERFDASLKSRDPSWGIRSLGEVQDEATGYGFGKAQRFPMPANNQTLVFRKL